MTIMDAARKWKLSPNWIRKLIKTKRLPAQLKKSGPVPYYEIPDGTPKPSSVARAPARLGSPREVTPAAVAQRARRAAKSGGKT